MLINFESNWESFSKLRLILKGLAYFYFFLPKNNSKTSSFCNFFLSPRKVAAWIFIRLHMSHVPHDTSETTETSTNKSPNNIIFTTAKVNTMEAWFYLFGESSKRKTFVFLGITRTHCTIPVI